MKVSAFFAVAILIHILAVSPALADTCTVAQRADFAKAGYLKAEIESMCGGASQATQSPMSRPATNSTPKTIERQPASHNSQILKVKITKAAEAFAARDYSSAASLFKEALALDPRDALAWHFLGQALAQNKDFNGARVAYEKALDLAPSGKVAERTRLELAKLPS